MHDSADMNSAKTALNAALDSLDSAIGPILSRMKALEAASQDTDGFREDRMKLAAQLDEMAAQAQQDAQAAQAATARLSAREAEFSTLARESEAELERVMNVVQKALG